MFILTSKTPILYIDFPISLIYYLSRGFSKYWFYSNPRPLPECWVFTSSVQYGMILAPGTGTGRWAPSTGHQSFAAGQPQPGTGHPFTGPGHSPARHPPPLTGHSHAGHRAPFTGHRALSTGERAFSTRHQALSIKHRGQSGQRTSIRTRISGIRVGLF